MSLFSAEKVSELDRFWREMAPVPGRMGWSLRFALTSALAALLLLIVQPPAGFIAPSMFMLFLVSHDSPLPCLRDLLTLLAGAAAGTIAILLMMIVTGDHPVARIVGLSVCTFLAAFFSRTSVIPGFPMAFGCLSYMVISLWELKIPAEKILHLSLWPMGTLATVALSALIVEILFNRSDPMAELQREVKARCAALDSLFQLLASGADPVSIERQSAVIRRYSVTGEGKLQVLLDRVSRRKACDGRELNDLRAITRTLDRLAVLAAGLDLCREPQCGSPARLQSVGNAILAAGERSFADVHALLGEPGPVGDSQLDRIEQTLRHVTDCVHPSAAQPQDSRAATPSSKSLSESLRKLLLPDAFTNPDHAVYAFKLSLCATICYVIYMGLAWPGISTCFFTVYFTGLSTTGTTNRKLFFRVVGSMLGGMLLGIGCLVFVFPNLEGVQGFLLVIAAVSFLGAWVSASSYFGYIGLQIVISFNFIAFEQLRAADQMTPARDRLLGITLGFLVMFFIFHQVRPERTVDTMKRMLASVLRAQAKIIGLFEVRPQPARERDAQIAAIRKQIVTAVGALQNFAHAVAYEFPPDRDGDMRLCNEILNAAARAEDLLVCVRALPLEWDGALEPERLRELQHSFESALRDLAHALENGGEEHRKPLPAVDFMPLASARGALPRVATAMDKLQELQMACEGVLRLA